MTIPPSQLRQELAAVFGEITAARRLAAAGRDVELGNLDDRIGALCTAILDLPRDEGRDLLPLLEDLRNSLNQLAATIKVGLSGAAT